MEIRVKDSMFDIKFYYSHIWESSEEAKMHLMNLIGDVDKLLTNYDTISSPEFLRIINEIYTIYTDEELLGVNFSLDGFSEDTIDYEDIIDRNVITNHEMIRLYNKINKTSYKKLTSIKTNMVREYVICEGHGRDYSEESIFYQVHLIILTDEEIDRNKVYTPEEIDKLVRDGKIMVITNTEVITDKKLLPKEASGVHDYGVSKEGPEYQDALVELIKEEKPKQELFKDTRVWLKHLTSDFRDFCHTSEVEKSLGVDKLDDFYQRKFKNKKKWNGC